MHASDESTSLRYIQRDDWFVRAYVCDGYLTEVYSSTSLRYIQPDEWFVCAYVMGASVCDGYLTEVYPSDE